MNAITAPHQDYRAFLEAKIKLASFDGFDVSDAEINPLLKPHQRAIVRWAIKGGRRAIFAAFGLGKSFMQLETIRLILKHCGGAGLLVLPLGVRVDMMRDAATLATGEHPQVTDAQRAELAAWLMIPGNAGPVVAFIRSAAEVEPGRIHLTNYETVRDGKLDPAKLAKAFTEFSLADVYDYDFHVRIGEELDARGALPSTFMSLAPGSHHSEVWHDVNRMLTLNGDQVRRNLEQHVCPLQFDIVDRLITRYSNPDEVVYDPFCGIGTVPCRAIKLGRRGGGSELSASYFLDGVHYCQAAEREHAMPSLFDLMEGEAA